MCAGAVGFCFSERHRAAECHAFACGWMAEHYGVGVQIQPVGSISIQSVATNGSIQSAEVGTMHAQLVCAPRLGE